MRVIDAAGDYFWILIITYALAFFVWRDSKKFKRAKVDVGLAPGFKFLSTVLCFPHAFYYYLVDRPEFVRRLNEMRVAKGQPALPPATAKDVLLEVWHFLASLHLALLLMSVIIAATARGTVLESNFNAEVAKRYIYNAWWFNIWMSVLCLNLFCVAAIRYPWKPHQTGFVITHAGIILLLIGGMVDRKWGIEGFLPLTRGDKPTDVMQLHKQEVRAYLPGTAESARTEFVIKEMLSERDRQFKINSPSAGIQIESLDVWPVKRHEIAVPDPGGRPALQLTLRGAQMGVHDYCLMMDDYINMGPATLRFSHGMPPQVRKRTLQGELTPRLEGGFVFAKAKMPAITLQGEPTGVEMNLSVDRESGEARLHMEIFEKSYTVPVQSYVNRKFPLEGLSDWHLEILGYFPDCRLDEDNKPINVSDQPNNPAVVYRLVGPLVPASEKPESEEPLAEDDPHAGHGKRGPASALAFYMGADGKLRYHIKTASQGEFSGEVVKGKSVPVPWREGVDFVVYDYLPKAVQKFEWRKNFDFDPKTDKMDNHTNGVLCRVSAGGDSREAWVPQSNPHKIEKIPVEAGGQRIDLAMTNVCVVLPFKVSNAKFRAINHPGMEGSSSYRSFETTLSFMDKTDSGKPQEPHPLPQRDTIRLSPASIYILKLGAERAQEPGVFMGAITEVNDKTLTFDFADRHSVIIPLSEILSMDKQTQKISMNRPTVYPQTWYAPWLGTSYKFSQAGHDPNMPDYSGVQVLRDPGWAPKWIGCLMICFGIFTMFYLKPYFGRRPQPAVAAQVQGAATAPAEGTGAGPQQKHKDKEKRQKDLKESPSVAWKK